VVDLADVDFVDPSGEAVLMQMHNRGVELVGETPLICSMLEELCHSVRCARVKGRAGSS
jgi:anti-anti-sigma regulatory factor